MADKKEKPVALTIDTLKAEHSEVYEAIAAEARTEGAKAELKRIQDVADQAMPGHEDLVNTLMYDGKTTGPEAAVQILQAEKKNLKNLGDDLDNDSEKPVDTVVDPPDGEGQLKHGPAKERAQAKWDADAKLRDEFNGEFETYLAYFEATDEGCVKVSSKK